MNVGDLSNPDYDKDPPSGGYPQPAEDIKVITQILNKLINDSSKDVLLVGHSSGGFTATAAAVPELQAKNRKSKGLKGGVIGIFYECAFLIPVGESVHSFFQPKDGSDPVVPPYSVIHAHGFSSLLSTKDGAKYFFNGLDEATAKHYESTLTASPVFTTILENDAYVALPCAYLVSEDDLALPAAYQEGMVAMQSQRPGVSITTYKAPCGHSPHLQWTEGLVQKIEEFGRNAVVASQIS
ncbi:MAG: hypothetical protein M1820_007330 [Bogoriella megaspora]|nr:MAG: hypothetical protein M1820_007330 [Bogoriella megaspora]